jgi:signal transduction histidine kinase
MRSLEARLLAAVGLLALAAVAGVALAARHGARFEIGSYLTLEHRASHEDIDHLLHHLAAGHPDGLAAADLAAAAGGLPGGTVVLLVDGHERLVAAAGEPLRGRTVEIARDGDSPDGLVVRMRAADGGSQDPWELHLRGAGVPVVLRAAGGGGSRGGTAQRGAAGPPAGAAGAAGAAGYLVPLFLPNPGERLRSAAVLGALDRRLVAVTGAAAELSLLATWFLARRILAPVRQLQEAARDLARGRLDRRVPAAGPEEIAELGRAFNGMAGELERQQQLRRDLVNDVAHELRAPLTAMLCRLDTGEDGLETDPAAALAGFRGDVEHLVRLVEDLQDLALADAGRLRLECVPTSVAEAAQSALRTAGLDLDPRLRLDVAAELTVTADPLRLRQALVNLLTNAARHTPAGGQIRLGASAAGAEVRIEVADSGCGLAEEQLARAFERFYRTDAARRRETGGSGLGLAIVKALIEAQHGRVWARSAPDAGASFGLALPAASPPARDTL